MSKTIIQAPSSGVKPHLQPWEGIAWPSDRLPILFSDWGRFYARKQYFHHGAYYMNKSLDESPDNTKQLIDRSQLLRVLGRAPEALYDCRKAEAITRNRGKNNPEVNKEVCDALYESNRLEDCKANLHRNLRDFSNSKKVLFLNRLHAVNENFKDTLSDKVAPAVQRLIENMLIKQAQKPTETKSDCDVVSILEKEEEVLSALEIARRKRSFKIFNQTYLNNCWIDVDFLRKLRTNSNLLLHQSIATTPYLRNLTNRDYKTVRTLTKMLHTRSPMYINQRKKFPSIELYDKIKRDNLFRIQYQTRRNMFKILKSIRHLISVGDLNKLDDFVEEVMGDYVTIKTNQIMPWKFEFINEVYNYLGLARINEFKIPREMTVLNGNQRLLKLFKIPTEKNSENSSHFVFGDKSAVQRSDLVDPKVAIFKQRIARMENRMRFARCAIERCYILHEIAKIHLENNTFDACCSVARKAIDQSKQCNSSVWQFLCLMIMCKAHAILGKVERESEALNEAFLTAQKMKNIDLCLFTDICLKVNAEEVEQRKMLMTPDLSLSMQRKQRSQRTASSLDNHAGSPSTFE